MIDASWDLCPYCPPAVPTGEIPLVRPRSGEASRSHGWSEPEPERSRSHPGPPIARTSPQSDAAPVSRTVAVPKGDLGLAPRYVVGWLVGLTGAVRGESFAVRIGKTSIGRDPKCDVVVFDDQTSGHHADLVFRPEEKRFILMDHNSTNGTYVNETEIEPRRDLANHDVVRIGAQRFVFVALDLDWSDPKVAP